MHRRSIYFVTWQTKTYVLQTSVATHSVPICNVLITNFVFIYSADSEYLGIGEEGAFGEL